MTTEYQNTMVHTMFINSSCRDELVKALRDAMTPFGSLSGDESELCVDLALAGPASRPTDLAELVRRIFAYQGDNCSNVEFHPCGVILITPTSQTRISVHNWSSGPVVEVKFPNGGSWSRASEIFNRGMAWKCLNDKGQRVKFTREEGWQIA